MIKEPTINIFTCVDKFYEDFIPLFVLSNLTYVPDSIIEIGVLNKERVMENEAVRYVMDLFPSRVFIRQVDFSRADKARFLINVENKAKYVYISDVDIITLRGNIVETHLEEMAKTGLPYSNGVRGDTKRMTGVHFTSYDAYYPIQKSEFNPILCDEELLYRIIRARKLDLPIVFFRPLFGIHISPQRYALGEPSWNATNYVEEWKSFRSTEEYKKLFPLLSSRVKNYSLIVDYLNGIFLPTLE